MTTPRHRWLITLSVVVLSVRLVAVGGSVQDASAPKPVSGVSQPAYPIAARAAGIEGEVRYRAAIRADGTVASVTVLSVPAGGLGFEEAVQAAVSSSTHPALLRKRGEKPPPEVTMPHSISQVKPLYPKEQLEAGRQSVLLFEAEITEHGTLVNMKHLKPVDASEDFKRSAQLAATLWRFEPATANGCRIRMVVTIEMSFRSQ